MAIDYITQELKAYVVCQRCKKRNKKHIKKCRSCHYNSFRVRKLK